MPSDKKLDNTENESSGVSRIKSADFVARYANYTYLETSVWDLKMKFGQTDGELGNTVPINSEITMPWPQVKAFHYFLGVHLAAHEAEYGRLKIPPGIVPEPSAEFPVLRKHYEAFIAVNPDAKEEK